MLEIEILNVFATNKFLHVKSSKTTNRFSSLPQKLRIHLLDFEKKMIICFSKSRVILKGT